MRVYTYLQKHTITDSDVYFNGITIPEKYEDTGEFRTPQKGEKYLMSVAGYGERVNEMPFEGREHEPRIILRKKKQTFADLAPGIYKGVFAFEVGLFLVVIRKGEKFVVKIDNTVTCGTGRYSHKTWSFYDDRFENFELTPIDPQTLFGDK